MFLFLFVCLDTGLSFGSVLDPVTQELKEDTIQVQLNVVQGKKVPRKTVLKLIVDWVLLKPADSTHFHTGAQTSKEISRHLHLYESGTFWCRVYSELMEKGKYFRVESKISISLFE